jgi:O-glycosyl hydrolase
MYSWQSMRINSQTEMEFIKQDLGPALKRNHSNVGILIFDDVKDQMDSWSAALDDPESSQYVIGTAVHWYS